MGEREGVGSGKVHRPELELGTPVVQWRDMSSHCPQDYLSWHRWGFVEITKMTCDSLVSICKNELKITNNWVMFCPVCHHFSAYLFMDLWLSWSFLYNFQVLLQIVLVKKVWHIVNILAQLIILAGQMKIRTTGLIRLADRNLTLLKILFHADLFFFTRTNVPDLRMHDDNLKMFMGLKLFSFIT